MQVWKTEVQSGKMCTGGKYKYGKMKYGYARMENASTELEKAAQGVALPSAKYRPRA